MKSIRNRYREIIDKFNSELVEGRTQDHYRIHQPIVRNPVSGRFYASTGAECALIEEFIETNEVLCETRWCTKEQINEIGWKIEDGAKPVKVRIPIDRLTPDNAIFGHKHSIEEDMVKAELYGENDIIGIPPLPLIDIETVPEQLRIIIKNYKIPIYVGANCACCAYRENIIQMPFREQFISDIQYVQTLVHELAHATGLTDKLGRNGSMRGTILYAREELIAELTAQLVLNVLNLPTNDIKSTRYFNEWTHSIDGFRDNEFKSIAGKAMDAADVILNFHPQFSNNRSERSLARVRKLNKAIPTSYFISHSRKEGICEEVLAEFKEKVAEIKMENGWFRLIPRPNVGLLPKLVNMVMELTFGRRLAMPMCNVIECADVIWDHYDRFNFLKLLNMNYDFLPIILEGTETAGIGDPFKFRLKVSPIADDPTKYKVCLSIANLKTGIKASVTEIREIVDFNYDEAAWRVKRNTVSLVGDDASVIVQYFTGDSMFDKVYSSTI
ncbi:MAG: zincin-like metallopeptidase domain-containing protein [Candidatus Methylumidiphilus sp.]